MCQARSSSSSSITQSLEQADEIKNNSESVPGILQTITGTEGWKYKAETEQAWIISLDKDFIRAVFNFLAIGAKKSIEANIKTSHAKPPTEKFEIDNLIIQLGNSGNNKKQKMIVIKTKDKSNLYESLKTLLEKWENYQVKPFTYKQKEHYFNLRIVLAREGQMLYFDHSYNKKNLEMILEDPFYNFEVTGGEEETVVLHIPTHLIKTEIEKNPKAKKIVIDYHKYEDQLFKKLKFLAQREDENFISFYTDRENNNAPLVGLCLDKTTAQLVHHLLQSLEIKTDRIIYNYQSEKYFVMIDLADAYQNLVFNEDKLLNFSAFPTLSLMTQFGVCCSVGSKAEEHICHRPK